MLNQKRKPILETQIEDPETLTLEHHRIESRKETQEALTSLGRRCSPVYGTEPTAAARRHVA